MNHDPSACFAIAKVRLPIIYRKFTIDLSQLFAIVDTVFTEILNTFISAEAEKARYLTHNNDVEDERYQQFVSPITSAVMKQVQPLRTFGLDYGAGTGPVIAKSPGRTRFQYRAI